MRSAGDLSSGCDVTVTILSTAAVIICTRKKDWNRGLLNKKRGVGLSWRGIREGCGISVTNALYTSMILVSIRKLIESLMGKNCLL